MVLITAAQMGPFCSVNIAHS